MSALASCISATFAEFALYARSKNCIYHCYIYIVHAKLDYCNSVYLNIDLTQINRLQAIQNALARAVTKTPKYHHITPILMKLHWLKIPERIEYKVISLTYNTLQSSQPSYLRSDRIVKMEVGGRVFL